MVSIINDKVIIMTRGDTLNVGITLKDIKGEVYIPVDGDVIRFAMKTSYESEEVILEKIIPIDTMTLHFDPEDTSSLEQPSEYVFDIQITMNDGTVDTFITNGRLVITEEIS